jgi:adenylate cyclase class IV
MITLIPPIYEVETRFRFQSSDEVWNILPIFQPYINQEVEWNTIHYSPTLFQADQILRINHVIKQGKASSLLGWKESDQGISVNIRAEIEEDITKGIKDSNILAQLGGKKSLNTPAAIATELIRLGHPQFMAFSGKNLTGEYEPQEFHLKLMLASTPAMRWPLLLEVEKTAHSPEEASKFETEIIEFVHRFRLEDRIVREEPPTLLYQALHLG